MTIPKKIIVTKKYNGYEWLKGQAQRGFPPMHQQVVRPLLLAQEVAVLRGIPMPTQPIGSQVSIFVMMRILRNNSGGYFRNASYRDAQVYWEALQQLRFQYGGTSEREIEGLRDLFLPGALEEKNRRILDELLVPYLEEMNSLGLWDDVRFYRELLKQDVPSHREGEYEIYHLAEDPMSPLELAVLGKMFPQEALQRTSLWQLLPCREIQPEASYVSFEGYGSINEWREVTDRMIKAGTSYDQFVVVAGNYARFAQYHQEQPILPFTLSEGVPIMGGVSEGMALRREQARMAGFTTDQLPDLDRALFDSLKSRRSPGETTQGGKAHLTTIQQLPFIYRPQVFLVGAEEAVISPAENPVLLDGDVLALRKKCPAASLKTSFEKTEESLNEYMNTVDWLKEQKQSITISYSHYDTASLKAKAKPSLLARFQNIFREEASVGYFEKHRIPLTWEERYMTGISWPWPREILRVQTTSEEGVGPVETLHISATQAEKMVRCPYYFALAYLLKMELLEEEKDPGMWLDPKERGTLCHEIFALYHGWDKRKASLSEKLDKMQDYSRQVIHRWLSERPPAGNPIHEIRELEKIATAYVYLKHPSDDRPVLHVEYAMEERECLPQILWIRGTADLVEGEDKTNKDGVVISDVKTGGYVEQVENDGESCLQTMLYCWLYQQHDKECTVEQGRYLYPKVSREIGCSYSESRKQELIGLLKETVISLESGEDWKKPDKRRCRYCGVQEYCQSIPRMRYYESFRKEGWILDL